MMSSGARAPAAATIVALGIALAGCASGTVVDAPDPTPARDGPIVTDCLPPFAFEGETTLGAIGLGDIPGLGEAATRRGLVRITRDTVTWAEFAPPDTPRLRPDGQMVCVTWPDGSGMSTLLETPFGVDATSGDVPPGLLLVAGAAILVSGAAAVAFRERRR